MPNYRFCLLAASGSIDSVATLRAATDDAAADLAAELLLKSASATAGVWENARLVFRVGKAAIG
jgi:hypothetical protein